MFKKYPKIQNLGHMDTYGILTNGGKATVQEKVDGANFSFYVEDGVLWFCSRNQHLKNSDQIEETGIPDHWKGVEPVLEAFKRDPHLFDESLICFGESMQKHRIKYDNIPGFIGFDVYDTTYKMFWNWASARLLFEGILELPFINTYCNIDLPFDNIDVLKRLYETSAYKDGPAEGIVIKRYDTQQFAKIVNDDFKEKMKQPRVIKDSSTERNIADVYATPARIEKIIYKLIDEGNDIGMTMMPELHQRVLDDIVDEDMLDILIEFRSFNAKTLASVVARKCVPILKNVMLENIQTASKTDFPDTD